GSAARTRFTTVATLVSVTANPFTPRQPRPAPGLPGGSVRGASATQPRGAVPPSLGPRRRGDFERRQRGQPLLPPLVPPGGLRQRRPRTGDVAGLLERES